MEKVLFSEKQRYPSWIAGVILLFCVIVLSIGAREIYFDDPDSLIWYLLVCSIGVVPILIIFRAGIEVKITESGFYYRVLPFKKKMKYMAKSEITLSYSVASNFLRFSKYGVKRTGTKKFLMIGKDNIQVERGKHTILIGTKKPREFQYFLERHWKET